MGKILSFVAIGICAAAVLCALLAVALPSWIDWGSYNSGLFRACVGGNCGSFTNPSDSRRACQAMTLLGFFCTIGTLVVLILFTFVMKGRKMLGYIAGIVSLVAGFLLLIGMAIFVDKIASSHLGAGFAFCVLGWLVSWGVGGFILFLTWKDMLGADAAGS